MGERLWLVRRPFKIFLGVVLAIFVGVSLYNILHRRLYVEETIEEAARNCLASIERGDTRRLMKYFREEEIALLELDFEKLDSFMNGFLLPRLKGFKPKGDPTLMPGAVTTVIRREYIHPDGRKTGVVLNLVETQEGPKLWHGTIQIIGLPIGSYPVEREVEELWGHTGLFPYRLVKALPDLERLALRRVAVPEPGGLKLKALTWREYAKREQLDWEREEKRKWPFE